MALRQTTYQIRLADGRTLACDPTGSPVFYPGSRLEGRSAADTARRLGLRLIAPIVPVSANPHSSQAERSVPGLQMWQNWRIRSHWAGLLSSECLVGRLCLRRSHSRPRQARGAVGGLGPVADKQLARDMVTRKNGS